MASGAANRVSPEIAKCYRDSTGAVQQYRSNKGLNHEIGASSKQSTQVPPLATLTHTKRRLSVFDCCSCGKRCYCCCFSAKVRLCEQGLCCNSAARQGKNDTVEVPSWYHMVHHSRYHRYEFGTGYQVPDRIYDRSPRWCIRLSLSLV